MVGNQSGGEESQAASIPVVHGKRRATDAEHNLRLAGYADNVLRFEVGGGHSLAWNFSLEPMGLRCLKKNVCISFVWGNRYMLLYDKQAVLRRHELDAFLCAALSPLLPDVDTMQEMKVGVGSHTPTCLLLCLMSLDRFHCQVLLLAAPSGDHPGCPTCFPFHARH